jgi:DNA helicase-2/ATP-dependent DNA helicase PcrA
MTIDSSQLVLPGVATDPDGRYLRALLGKPFTDEQLAVITAPLSPTLVVAGAGSGKTTVMAARVVHAVAFHEIAPASVLGLTFTNKAAGQLAESVRSALRRLEKLGALAAADADVDDTPTVATYHSYAASIVRDHALRIGREPLTTLLTEAGRWQLAMRVVRRAEGPFRHIGWQPVTVASYLLDLDGELAEHLCGVDDVQRFDREFIEAVESVPKLTKALKECADAARARDELLSLVVAYRAEKARLDLIDYGDQVALAALIAQESEDVRRIENDRFSLVLLDEYQDTGVAQRILLSTLFADRAAVTGVGDPHQAIYGWRGASIGNLLRFHEHFGGDRPLPLMTSFRCGGRILAAANALAEPLRQPSGRGRAAVEVPLLAPTADAEDAGEVVVALHQRVDDEAAWIAERISTAIDVEGVAPKEIAVLCRRRSDFPLLHGALIARGVPVEVIGLGGLLEMPEVADVVATLRVLVDPTANSALVRILTGPRWRIGPRDLAALGHRAHRLTTYGAHDEEAVVDVDVETALRRATEGVDEVEVVSLTDALDSLGTPEHYSSSAYERLVMLRDELRALRPLVGQPIVEIATAVTRLIGLDVEIEAEPGRVGAARAANLAAFLDHAAAFTGIEGESDLLSFLGWLDAAVAAESGLDIGGVSDADTVKLLTVHKAKGLEWDVVAVPGLTAGVFPSRVSRSRWTSAAKVLPFPCRGDAVDLPATPDLTTAGLDAFKAACRGDDDDEERRLGYVALTRARKRLLLSGYWWGATQKKPLGPSPYLEELHALEDLVTVDEWVTEPGEENPVAADAAGDVAWPPDHASAAFARRGAAAELVNSALDGSLAAPKLTARELARAQEWDREASLLLDELRRARTVVRDVPLPRRLTASQVVALAHDPDGLAAMLARPVPVRPEPQARRGSRFHRWVEQLYGASPLIDPEELPGAGDAAMSDEELAQLQAKFLDAGWGERRPVAVEQPFELVVAGRLVRGRIDAVYANGERYDVIDFKTGSVPRDFAAASLQLTIYRLAWADLAGVDPDQVDAGFLYVRTGEVKRPDRLLSRDELAVLLAPSPPAVLAPRES